YEGKLAPLSPFVRLNPSTKLASLRQHSSVETSAYRCIVLREGKKIDDDPCTIHVRTIASDEWPNGLVAEFTWPSGAKTVVIRDGNRSELNGTATALRRDDRYGACFANSRTGNEFCFQRN